MSRAVNAQTKQFHTENDCSYTLVTVTKQEKVTTGKGDREYLFVFKLKDGENFGVRLKYGVLLVFSGKILTHRQSCSQSCLPNEEFFTNFALYGLERL